MTTVAWFLALLMSANGPSQGNPRCLFLARNDLMMYRDNGGLVAVDSSGEVIDYALSSDRLFVLRTNTRGGNRRGYPAVYLYWSPIAPDLRDLGIQFKLVCKGLFRRLHLSPDKKLLLLDAWSQTAKEPIEAYEVFNVATLKSHALKKLDSCEFAGWDTEARLFVRRKDRLYTYNVATQEFSGYPTVMNLKEKEIVSIESIDSSQILVVLQSSGGNACQLVVGGGASSREIFAAGSTGFECVRGFARELFVFGATGFTDSSNWAATYEMKRMDFAGKVQATTSISSILACGMRHSAYSVSTEAIDSCVVVFSEDLFDGLTSAYHLNLYDPRRFRLVFSRQFVDIHKIVLF